MKARGAAIQGGLALAGLALAYGAWQQPVEKSVGDAVVVDANKNDVAKIRYEDDKSWVEVTREGEGEQSVWVRLSARTEGANKAPERLVRGNDAAEKLFASFAPLKAARSLGVIEDAAKLKEFGLDASKRRIEVTAKGDKRAFTVATPSGSFTPYLKDERDKHVYTLANALLSDLESAPNRMVDRRYHLFKPGEYDTIKISAGAQGATKTRELIVTTPETPTTAKLASKKSPDKPDETAKNWHDKIWYLLAVEALGKGETPASGNPEILLRVDYSLKNKEKGFLEIGRVVPPPRSVPDGGAPSTAAPAAEVYARSEMTAGWIKVGGNGDDLIKEAEKIAGTE